MIFIGQFAMFFLKLWHSGVFSEESSSGSLDPQKPKIKITPRDILCDLANELSNEFIRKRFYSGSTLRSFFFSFL